MNKEENYMSSISAFKKFIVLLVVATVIVGVATSALARVGGSALLVPKTAAAAETATFGGLQICNVTASAYEVPAGANLTISWQTEGFSSYTLNGVAVSGPNGSKTFMNVQQSDTYTLIATTADGRSNCTASVTVVCIPVPPPTCTLTPSTKTINSGESVTLSWTTTAAKSATLTSFGAVPVNGSQNTGPLTASTNYTLAVLGNNGETVSCHSAITVETVVPPVCELTLTKAVNKTTAVPGDELVYTMTIKNTGTGNCSGSGVKIVDVHDAQLTFVSASQSSNILPGYVDIPQYTKNTRTIVWNGDVLTPGEQGTMTWTAKVNALTCGTSKVIKNTVRATALELNNYTTWISSNTVETVATGADCPVPPPTCTLTPVTKTIASGSSVDLTWTTTNAKSATLTDFGTVALSGTKNTGALTASKTYTLTVVGNNETTITCQSAITIENTPPAPTCDAFTATPKTIVKGASSTLAWSTTNATRVVIDNGVGEVAVDGSVIVSPLSSLEYTLKAYSNAGAEAICKTTVQVTEILVPECTAFTATPTSLPTGGGVVTLAWSTKNATGASISPTIGTVAVNGSATTTIATTTAFTLTLSGDNNQSKSCTVTVPVATAPTPLTCAANVSLSASPSRISRGNDSVITWNTTGVEAVSFNQGITATGLSGTVTVEPRVTTTYTMTATRGTESVSCPVTVTVTTGGGGGSSSPTCELSVSDNKITRGDTVTLRWDSRRATELELVASTDKKVLVTTEGKRDRDKDELFDGSLRVSPAKDTTYTLTVSRGSKERTCKVNVDVEDTIVVTEVRDQQPLIAGIALSQVPYTGFKAGPIMTVAFYLLLGAWALYIAYLLVVRRDVIGGYTLATANAHIVAEAPTPEEIRPDVFVASVRPPLAAPSSHVPVNLPTATPVVGYAELVASAEAAATPVSPKTTPRTESTDEIVTALENHAHAKRALLSSDAIRHLMGSVTSKDQGIETLNEVIIEAKAQYPSEDGWVVINERRMRDLCDVCQAKPAPSSTAPFVPAVIPEGSGSLAEAIVTGNIVAAYEMIGNRPMFALADASADLDALYRARRTGASVGSTLLQAETAKLSDAQILAMIQALTSALDGVYTDEASAVKMAIMKAVKVVA